MTEPEEAPLADVFGSDPSRATTPRQPDDRTRDAGVASDQSLRKRNRWTTSAPIRAVQQRRYSLPEEAFVRMKDKGGSSGPEPCTKAVQQRHATKLFVDGHFCKWKMYSRVLIRTMPFFTLPYKLNVTQDSLGRCITIGIVTNLP